MVPPRRPPGESMNGSGKRDSSMSMQRKDGGPGKGDAKTQNGARSGFRTDTAISNSRSGGERTLKRWVPDAPADLDGSLEKSSSKTGEWDQFAANERLFGLKTDYNENFYTTAIDKSHPQYSERLAAAEKKAREIEKSTATTAHVAEERVMDFAGDGKDEDEEDKYSGVRRQQDFPPLSSSGRDNKYTPPARRAPTGHSTVVGAPVDPAIIMSQVKGGPSNNRKQFAPKSDEQKGAGASSNATSTTRAPAPVATPLAKVAEPKADSKATEKKQAEQKVINSTSSTGNTGNTGNAKSARPTSPNHETTNTKASAPGSSTTTSLRPGAAAQRASLSPNAKPTGATSASSVTNSPTPSSAADGVEKALLKEFKNFASQERLMTDKIRQNKMKADQQVRLLELKKFAKNFKLTTPVPSDLISIIAKDPAKQKQIQEKALQNVEELAKTKTEPKPKETPTPAATASKASSTSPSSASGAGTSSAATPSTVSGPSAEKLPHTNNTRPHGPVHSGSPSVAGRHPNARGAPYMQQGYRQQSQPYRNDRSGQHLPQGPSTGHLAERLRNNMDQNRYPKQQPGPHGHYNAMGGEMRAPPTGPANSMDNNYSRRISAIPSGAHAHNAAAAQKLNPTILEFRPSPFAASFNPTGPSAGSSPRSAINNVSSDPNHPSGTASAASVGAAATSPRVFPRTPIRRKVNGVDPKKCLILDFVRSIKPPTGRNWDNNDGMRPSFDTAVTWRPAQDDEKPESTMRLSYTEYFERLAFAAASMVTPLQGHVMPHNMQQMVHPHVPLHLQQHGGHMGPRPGHMAPMPMHAGAGVPHGPNGHMPFNGNDDQRMMHSNSAQSYASPRMSQVPMYPQVGGTPQMAFNQPMMPFVPGTPQMNNYRNYPNTPQQFMPPQSGPMMPMMPPQFVAVPGGMMPPSQQMPVYAGGHQYMAPPGASGPAGVVASQQPLGGSSGYPSPGRPVAAPMMSQQGSQQGQPMYGMSPSLQYQQPAFAAQHPGQGGPMRGGYNSAGSQQFGTSPQQMHQYGPPHRNGSGSYGGKNYANHNSHNSHQGPPPQHHGPPKSRSGAEGAEEAK